MTEPLGTRRPSRCSVSIPPGSWRHRVRLRAGKARPKRPEKSSGTSTRPGAEIDACGRLRLTTAPSLSALSPPLLDLATVSNAYIDSMMVYATIFGYYNTYSPGGGLGLIAHAERYYLDNGTSWDSGAGSFYPSLATYSRVEVSGDTLRYSLAPPTDGFLYRHTDYDSGDHSAQGEIAVEGPLVIVALAGSTDGIMTGYGRITSNVPTWYGEPRFNYYRAPVGSIVPFRMRYQLVGRHLHGGAVHDQLLVQRDRRRRLRARHATAVDRVEVTGPARIPDRARPRSTRSPSTRAALGRTSRHRRPGPFHRPAPPR